MSRTYAASRPSVTAPSSCDRDVVDDPHAVAEPVGAAPLDRLPDRRQPEGLAGVDGEVGVLALEVLERVEVPGGRVAGLGAGDVEAGHAAVAPGDGQLGDLHRARLVAHRGEQLADDDPAAGGRLAGLEALLDGRDDLVEGEALLDVLLGGVADLGVHHAVRGQVLDALARHPGDRRAGLHDADRVVEGLEVAHQRAGVGGLGEPAAERLGVVGRAARGRSRRRGRSIVWGRSPPSRWSCSSTFGALRTWSRVRALGSVEVAVMAVILSGELRQRHDGVRHARLHHPGRDGRRGRRGARHLRVARRSTRSG